MHWSDLLKRLSGDKPDLIEEARKILKAELDQITLKSVNEVLREYEDKLDRWMKDVLNGNMTGGEMSRAMRAIIKRLAPESYTEGMREGGIRDPESEMENEDDEAVAEWTRDQLLYVDGFIESIVETSKLDGDKKIEGRNSLLDRIDEWVSSMRFIGQKGYLSAKGNLPLTWKVGDTEHCPTCLRLDGQRHRASWYAKRDLVPRQPGSNSLDCKGFNCMCSLVNDDGDQIIP